MLAKKDEKYIWHPFTQEKTASLNIPIKKGKGVWIYDEDDKKYLDAISSWWVNIHGHAHPYMRKKIDEQLGELEHVIFAGFTHPKAIEISERLITKLGDGFDKVFFSDNGSTSNEVALKMSFQYFYNQGKKKTKIIAFKDSYHGDTYGAMSVGGRSDFSKPFEDNLFDVFHLDVPTDQNFQQVRKQLIQFLNSGDVAAFVFEPLVLGTAGMITYKVKHLNELMSMCKAKGVLNIADEVFTGFYRTGKLFAHQYLNIKPDLICLSKGLTGGYLPLGLTITHQKIYDAFYSEDKKKAFFHGHSYTGNPLSCAAACASLDLLENQETLDGVKRIVQKHKDFIKVLQTRKEVQGVRQIGTILAFDLKSSTGTSYFNKSRDKLYQFFIDKGILMRPLGNTLYIVPPYCISSNELDLLYNAIKSLLNQIRSGNIQV
ncbi:MAG: adenosylmethionine-8-amino-7-oxononanoate aminotransferase [Glaciecola sp.]|jgi:adenosylmethionine-8-amino-7-oxononanoate aminotransferase